MNKYELNLIASKQANRFRHSTGLSSDEPISLRGFLVKENIVTLFSPLSGEFSGMAIKNRDDRFMMINSRHTIGRQNFSIAHELYHLYIQEDFVPKLSTAGKFNKSDTIEYQADLFAVHFLMPESGIRSIIPYNELGRKLGLKTIFKISSVFQVSFEATINRLSDLQLINKSERDDLINLKETASVTDLARMYGGDVSIYKSDGVDHLTGDYAFFARNLFETNRISEISYLDIMSEITHSSE